MPLIRYLCLFLMQNYVPCLLIYIHSTFIYYKFCQKSTRQTREDPIADNARDWKPHRTDPPIPAWFLPPLRPHQSTTHVPQSCLYTNSSFSSLSYFRLKALPISCVSPRLHLVTVFFLHNFLNRS